MKTGICPRMKIKGKLKKKAVNNPPVMDYFESVFDRLIAAGHIKNAEVYKDTKRNIKHFIGSKRDEPRG